MEMKKVLLLLLGLTQVTTALNPCSNYKSLNAAYRLESFTGQNQVRCDHRDITPGWYRFTGVAGSPQIPTSCPPVRRCGTHAPGWIKGQHPSVADGEVTRQVCYHWSNNCCRWKNNIKVKNCGAFYVYELQKTPACSLRYCVTSNDPCSNYKTLNAADRLERFTGQSPVRCDQRDIIPGWYRFTGILGNLQMPTTCPPERRCGTHAPGWIKGQHPSGADGEVTREVCYHWANNCCRWKNNIKIKNCGPFYVYELQKTPACSLRYCATIALGPCSNYKSLNAVDRLESFTGQSQVRCDQRDITPGWYRFTGVAGNPKMPTSCPSERRCGTHAPGWIKGQHPSVANGEVTREVCYHWANNCCRWKNNIKVKNCGAFYVYELQKTPACSLRYCVASYDPCGNYKSLNAADRLETFTGQSPVRCDQRDIIPGWYRFTAVAGNPQMPTSCPPVRRCGTHAPGWIKGHPSVADGEVTRQVCYHWANNCCQWKNNIKVKNCGAFYVYNLQKTPACSLRYCVASSDPCSNYKTLNAAHRLESFTGQSQVRCDQRDITPGWYRFTGVAGNPKMPTTCPPVRRCGTHAPGWIKGQHPSVADGEVTREVCYHWTNNCCRWKNDIKVKNCGGAFYVYELQKTPACSLRYCVASNISNNPCSKYKTLNAADRLITFTGQSPVRCDKSDLTPGWYRFTGVAGNPKMPTSCPSVRRCGTLAPGWIKGQHPSVADGEVTREVCYHWSQNCCQWKNNIKVKNCGAFYVYELKKTPGCSLRYCAAP